MFPNLNSLCSNSDETAKTEETDSNLSNLSNVPNFSNFSNLSNVPNFSNVPNLSNISNVSGFSNFSNDSQVPAGINFGSNWNFNSLQLAEGEEESSGSLDALAKLHLEDNNSGSTFLLNPLTDLGLNFSFGSETRKEEKENVQQNFGEFKIPPLFSSVNSNVEKKSTFEIDLTSALLQKTSLHKTSKPQIKRNDENLYVESKNILEGLLLLPENEVRKKTLIRPSERPSKAAFVVCREWNRKKRICLEVERTSTSTLTDAKLTPFAFDTPSPDDVIKAAQSNVFQRTQK